MPKVYKVHYVRHGHPIKSWPRTYEHLAGARAALRYNIRDSAQWHDAAGVEVFMEIAERTDWVREA